MKNLFIIIAFIFVNPLNAQRNWTLEECVEEAWKNNLQVKQAEIEKNNSEINLTQSKTVLLPRLNASATQNYNVGRSVDPYTNTYKDQQVRSNSFNLSGGLTLFSGFQNINAIRQQTSVLESSNANLMVTRNDIALKVSEAFLNVLLAEEILKINQEQIATTNQVLERNKKLFDAGRLNQSAVLDVEAQKATEELNIVTSQNNIDMAYLILWQYMQHIPREKETVVKPANTEQLITLQERYNARQLYEIFKLQSPELRKAKADIQTSNFALKSAKGLMSPTISLNAQISTLYSQSYISPTGYTIVGQQILYYDLNNNPIYAPVTVPTETRVTKFSDQLGNNLSKFVGFNMSIPIFNAYQNTTSIRLAKNTLQNSNYMLQNAENTIFQAINKAVTDYDNAFAKLNASKKSSEAQKKSYEYAELRNEAGLLNYVELAQIKNNLTNAQLSYQQAVYEFIFKQKVLEFYKNGTLNFNK